MKRTILWGGALAVPAILLMLVWVVPVLREGRRPVLAMELPEQSLTMETGENPLLNTNYVYYEGGQYVYNYELYNVLFMGIDKTDTAAAQEIIGTAGQADSIILLSFDRAAKNVRLLQISRDTMTDIDIYDLSGNPFGTYYGQLALQYAYAPGGESSSWAMKQTVRDILFDLQIDSYVVLDIQGLPMINEEIGGVEIRLSADYSDIDPSFQAGASLVLDGAAAEQFVRKRDVQISGSNQDRMERQTEYIYAFFQTFKKRKQEGRLDMERILDRAGAYLTTDIQLEEMEELSNYDYSTKDIISVPGEIRQGEVYEEFHVDDEALKRLLIEMFYEPAS